MTTELLQIQDSKSNVKVTDHALHVGIAGTSGNIAKVNDSGQVHTVMRGMVDDKNSTQDNLNPGGVFTGSATDTMDYSAITIIVHTDQPSAENGLKVEYSSDQVEWVTGEEYNIVGGATKFFTPTLQDQYYRLSYTNGSATTTDFHIHATMRKTPIKWSSHNIDDPITDQDDAELVKAVLTAKKDDGEYINIGATNNENLRVSVQEYGDTPAIDAFDRLRISEPFTIFDSKQLHDKQPLFWDEETGGSATSTHSSIDANVAMTVTASASDYVIRQTKQRFNYQPGKSQLIFFTFQSPQVSGVDSRMGLFSGTGTNNLTPNNGIFFECNGTLSWNVAKNGSIAETATQSNWNVDPLDGTGASGITLDMTATQIGVIDFEWLGVGRVRVGFVIDGLIYYCHYFNHSNDNTFTSVYMSSPNLPLRYSIETDGTNGSTLDHICSSVISEGGIEKTGILRSVDTGNTYLTSLNTGNSYALIGIRLKAAYNDVTIIPEGLSIFLGTNDAFKWQLQLNPTIAGTFTYNDLANSAVQYATGGSTNTITTDGIVISSGGGSTSTRQSDSDLQTALRIGQTIGGVMDELVLVIRPFSTNLSAWAGLNFRELL